MRGNAVRPVSEARQLMLKTRLWFVYDIWSHMPVDSHNRSSAHISFWRLQDEPHL